MVSTARSQAASVLSPLRNEPLEAKRPNGLVLPCLQLSLGGLAIVDDQFPEQLRCRILLRHWLGMPDCHGPIELTDSLRVVPASREGVSYGSLGDKACRSLHLRQQCGVSWGLNAIEKRKCFGTHRIQQRFHSSRSVTGPTVRAATEPPAKIEEDVCFGNAERLKKHPDVKPTRIAGSFQIDTSKNGT